MKAVSLSAISRRLITGAGAMLVLYGINIAEAHAAALPKAEPVIIYGQEKPQQITDEKGQVASAKRPVYFNILLGNTFSLPDSTAGANAQTFAESKILRTGESIYKATGAAMSTADYTPGFEPALRLEWEIPFERIGFMPAWRDFTALVSLEGGFTTTQNLLNSSGPFRYQNDQAVAAELKDLTYSGTLTVSEKRQSLTPMLGVGTSFRLSQLELLLRLGGGISLQNGQRSYELALNPQYVSVTSNPTYSDSYVIKSAITQSYTTAILAAGRAELGARMRISRRTHLALIGSFTVLYGVLPFDNTGVFAEQGGQKTVYQKVVTGISDEDSFRLIPGIFLALSLEL